MDGTDKRVLSYGCVVPIDPRAANRYRHKSLIDGLQQEPVFLAHLARLLQSARAFRLEASEIALDVTEVELEVTTDDVCIVAYGLGIVRQVGANRGKTGFGRGISGG